MKIIKAYEINSISDAREYYESTYAVIGYNDRMQMLCEKYDLTVDLEAVPIAGVKSFAEVADILRIIKIVLSIYAIGALRMQI